MIVELNFPGGLEVGAQYKGFTILTDQPERNGGTGKSPSPFDLFVVSIATCVGYYVLRFCREREIETNGLAVTLEPKRPPDSKHTSRMRIDVTLPENFPDKYFSAVRRAIDQCSVKRHILDPPDFEIEVNHG